MAYSPKFPYRLVNGMCLVMYAASWRGPSALLLTDYEAENRTILHSEILNVVSEWDLNIYNLRLDAPESHYQRFQRSSPTKYVYISRLIELTLNRRNVFHRLRNPLNEAVAWNKLVGETPRTLGDVILLTDSFKDDHPTTKQQYELRFVMNEVEQCLLNLPKEYWRDH